MSKLLGPFSGLLRPFSCALRAPALVARQHHLKINFNNNNNALQNSNSEGLPVTYTDQGRRKIFNLWVPSVKAEDQKKKGRKHT